MSNSQQQLSTERVLELLANPQRRQILHKVADAPDGTTVDQLISELEAGESMHPEADDAAERRGIELHHSHLPKLQETDVLEYDTRQGIVYQGQRFQDVLSLLETIEEHRE